MLNTIYVTSEGAWLRKDGANLVVEVDGEERGRAPLHMLEGVVAFGWTGASPALMAACAEAGIAISFCQPNGRFLARIEGARSGNVLLRRRQYRLADNPSARTALVRSIVVTKVANQRTVLLRALRDHGKSLATDAAIAAATDRLADAARRTMAATDVDALRGIEGEAAAQYFSVFGLLVRTSGEAFAFCTRSRRPPMDRMNALLSFLYAMLGHDCRSALESHGLDPQVGFLHSDRPGRAGLALDLMEELRPILADRLALSLVNRGQVKAEDFLVEEAGAVRMTDDTRKTVLIAWQDRKKHEIQHPFLGEKAPLGMIAYLQAQLMARTLRGDLDGYPPFIWR